MMNRSTRCNLVRKRLRPGWCRAWPVMVSLCLLPVLAPAASAQNAPQVSLTTNKLKKMVLVNGRPTPLLWADGIARVTDLNLYKRTGLNTVVVRLNWRPTDDGRLVPEDLEGPRGFAEAAAREGLQVIYSLPPAPSGQELNFRTAADSEAYFILWSSWVHDAIASLRSTPNLLGWMLPNDPRALPYADDVGFVKWLKNNFADISVLNKQWKLRAESFDDVTISGTQALIDKWKGEGPLEGGTTPEDLANRVIASRKPRLENDEWAFHPAALALAHYRWEAYRALVARWTSTIKESDPLHPVISGRVPDYAQLLAMPGNVDVVVPDIEPDIAENDLATHNPQAIDIARRAGRFAATPVFVTTPSRLLSPEMLAQAAPMWMMTALAHGASGLVFSSWNDLADNAPMRLAVEKTLREFTGAPYADMWDAAPASTAAVLLTPLADGHTLQIGRNSEGLPAGDSRGLYGFANGMISDEPSNLVYALRWGTAYGSIDYISPDDADTQTLERYSTVLMPQALSLGNEQSRALSNYVENGGVLVTDLGIGAAQDGWQVLGMPPAVSNLFGVAPPLTMRNLAFNLQALQAHPLFSTWNNASSTGAPAGSTLTAGDGPGGSAFTGPVTFSPLLLGTTPLGLAFRLPEPFGKPKDKKTQAFRFLDSNLTLRQQGAGYAIYAPFRLWSNWRPEHYGFATFHGDLFARGSSVVQLNAAAFVPSPAGGAPLYPQIINFPGAIALLNHAPFDEKPVDAPGVVESDLPQRSDGYSTVQTWSTGSFLWSDSVNLFGDSSEMPRGFSAHPAPIPSPDAYFSRPRLTTLYTSTEPQAVKILRLLPVAVQNLGGGYIAGRVTSYNPNSTKINIWPNAEAVTPGRPETHVGPGDAGNARVTIFNSNDAQAYKVAPGSRHKVAFTDLTLPAIVAAKPGKKKNEASNQVTQIVTADAEGQLRIEVSGSAISVEVTPAP